MPKGQKTPVEQIQIIKELRAEGRSVSQIVTQTGVPQTTVTRICKMFENTKKSPHRLQTIRAQKKLLQGILYPKFPQMSTPATKFPTKISAARSRAIPILKRTWLTARNFSRRKEPYPKPFWKRAARDEKLCCKRRTSCSKRSNSAMSR